MTRGPRRPETPSRTHLTLAAIAALAGMGSVTLAESQPQSVTLQWFEADWNAIEYRMPDFFVAGYSSTWLPPISIASLNSPGYDPFERFHIGVPGEETFYGTFRDFRAMVDQFHRASSEVYIDTILNHNGGRTGDEGFHAAGGWPGFWANWTGGTKQVGTDWGDYNDGTTQSEFPGSPDYDLWRGDLVGLVDHKLDSNNWMVRHPIDDSLPQGVQSSQFDPARRIPEGTFRNRPNPANERWYPDTSLTPKIVNAPGIFRPGTEGFPSFNIPAQQWTIYPFNVTPGEGPHEATGGDPVVENVTAIHMRWCQWVLEVLKVDGFRLDAAKHMEPWFFDQYFDPAVFDRRTLFDGSTGTPFSFGESTASDNFILNYYIRKDGFGNRDTLDLSGAGTIRNIINANGLGNLASIDDSGIDISDDGFNNGSLGLLHAYSHDNGTRGDGGSAPLWPYEDKMAPWAHAYLLLRTGRAIVYHNARAEVPNTNRFWPRQGIPTALGVGEFYQVPSTVPDGQQPPTRLDNRFTKLVQLRNQYGRGFYIPRWETNDLLVFERQGNMLVGISDSYSSGFDTVTVNTDFPQGTVLVELTGNASNPEIDPTNQIFDSVTVGSGGQVTIRVPRNVSSVRQHSSGYVAYGPQTPQGTVVLPDATDVILADGPSVPSAIRRLTPMEVITTPTFDINLITSPNQFDTNHDDNALFRLNAGYQDYNNDGQMSRDEVGSGQFEQYERFLTTNNPGISNFGNGFYTQTVNTDDLPEGRNYLSVIAFRNRAPGSDPLLSDFRKVIYVDRHAPDVSIDVSTDCTFSSATLTITNPDQTATDVQVFTGIADGDPLPAPVQANIAQSFDRGIWTYGITGITEPSLDIAVAVIEDPGNLQSGNGEVNRTVEYLTIVTGIKGDVNLDGKINAEDVYEINELLSYDCRADIDSDLDVDDTDALLLADQIRAGELSDALANR
ncbi:MAG: hypothetical protein Tsb0013_15600 [Phycisphaerales bacterium]